MQNSHNKIIIFIVALFFVFMVSQIAYASSGRRKHFLSHGPSTASFSAGETVFSAYKDPSIIQYNPSLMAFFQENGVSLSRFNLFEGSSYNSGTVALGFGKNYFLGFSVSNLSSGNIELRDDIHSPMIKTSINNWSYMLSGAGLIKSLDIAYGLSVKYIYYDLHLNTGGTFAVDGGLSKNFKGPELFGSVSKIKVGLSAQNIVSGDLKIDKENDDIPAIYRLSSAIAIPVYYRFQSQDTVSIYADLKYEDDFLDLYGGVSYTLADKYSIRAGYYPEHFTFGFGIEFYSFGFDYAADFGEIELINRFGLSYKWGGRKTDELAIEAQEALNKEKITLKEAGKRFNRAKKLYNKGEYLRATDMLSEIVVSYPNFESPEHFYNKIINDMRAVAESNSELDFEKLTYARGYYAYYNANYKEALSEWSKYKHFTGGSEEIDEYFNKISDAIKLEQMKKREAELDMKSSEMLTSGIKSFNEKKWIACIKKMEQLQQFVSKNSFSKTVEYYSKAKDYIDRSVKELSKSIKTDVKEQTIDKPIPVEEKPEVDVPASESKYNAGLILYAQGRYFEAERIWELTLRLNPDHQKAKIALSKLRSSGYLAE